MLLLSKLIRLGSNGAENIGCFLFRDHLPVRLLLLLLLSPGFFKPFIEPGK